MAVTQQKGCKLTLDSEEEEEEEEERCGWLDVHTDTARCAGVCGEVEDSGYVWGTLDSGSLTLSLETRGCCSVLPLYCFDRPLFEKQVKLFIRQPGLVYYLDFFCLAQPQTTQPLPLRRTFSFFC